MSGVSGGKNDAFLYEQAKTNYPKSFICTQKIVTYIKSSYAFELSLDEQVIWPFISNALEIISISKRFS